MKSIRFHQLAAARRRVAGRRATLDFYPPSARNPFSPMPRPAAAAPPEHHFDCADVSATAT